MFLLVNPASLIHVYTICSSSYQLIVRLFSSFLFLLSLAFNLKYSLLETNRVLYQNISLFKIKYSYETLNSDPHLELKF